MANRGSFKPGDGRPRKPKGALNRTSKDARELAQRLIGDEAYIAALKQRLIDGKSPDMEKLLFSYAYGPPSSHPISVLDNLDPF